MQCIGHSSAISDAPLCCLKSWAPSIANFIPEEETSHPQDVSTPYTKAFRNLRKVTLSDCTQEKSFLLMQRPAIKTQLAGDPTVPASWLMVALAYQSGTSVEASQEISSHPSRP